MKKNVRKTLAVLATTAAFSTMATGCAGAAGTSGTAELSGTMQTSATADEVETAATASTQASASTESTSAGAADIMNSYDNTKELAQKFKIVNATPIADSMGEKIENRLLTGFENWNRGYDAWAAWGDILYTEDSIYNVHGARLTLPEYQASMNATLSKINIQMGDFNNMVICDNWAAIHYDIITTVQGKSKPGSVMEFVEFKDYGDKLGTRVVEGWGGPKDASYDSMCMFQQDAEKKVQQENDQALLNYQIPDSEELTEKYPVKNPTKADSDNADAMQQAILENFDSWNQGYDAWAAETGNFYTADAVIDNGDAQQNLATYQATVKEADQTTDVQKLYFDNMLISGDWAAIHYRYVSTDLSTKIQTTGDAMQFFHFVKDGNDVRVDKVYTKCMNEV
ncbi:MAG: nuclear transport factor 2 family protein [Butyrivibrio sp.]|nr:nuclear transport factor 2 family protein [Butyrivibrio sp.]